jgi:Vitamin B6 photo-protection and homoeostasis
MAAALQGWMSHSLATSSLLQAVGVHPGAAGTAGATAAVKWITKDGIGAFGRLLVGTVQTLSTLTAAHGSRSGPTTSCILALQPCCRCQDDVLHVCVCQLGQVPSLTQVGGRLGTVFDEDPKRWRMLAEALGTLGMSLEIATAFAPPQAFLLLAGALPAVGMRSPAAESASRCLREWPARHRACLPRVGYVGDRRKYTASQART